MCTVAFLPNNGNYYFASLRDESPKRANTIAPDIYTVVGSKFLAPIDSQAGGTWVGVNTFGNVIILLNGAFKNHEKQNNYRKSRGVIVTELLVKPMPVDIWQSFNCNDIEPFTLIVFNLGKLYKLIWDGVRKYCISLRTNKAYIWSSATLYNAKATNKRELLFQNWVQLQPTISKYSILNFFKSVNDIDNGFLINRSATMQTLSYTFLELNKDNIASMSYYDLLSNTYAFEKINFNASSLTPIYNV